MNKEIYISNLKSIYNTIHLSLLESINYDFKGSEVLDKCKDDIKNLATLNENQVESNIIELSKVVKKDTFNGILNQISPNGKMIVGSEEQAKAINKAVSILKKIKSKKDEIEKKQSLHLEGSIKDAHYIADNSMYIPMLMGIGLMILGTILFLGLGVRHIKSIIDIIRVVFTEPQSLVSLLKNIIWIVLHYWGFKICCLPLILGVTIFWGAFRLKIRIKALEPLFKILDYIFEQFMKIRAQIMNMLGN